MIDPGRYTSGRIALGNLSAAIDGLELRRAERLRFQQLLDLSNLLFVRGDVLGRSADHHQAELVARDAIGLSPDTGPAQYTRARLAERFHRFDEANVHLERALAAGYPSREIDAERAVVLQATGDYRAALVLREKLAQHQSGMETLWGLASLLSAMNEWPASGDCYTAALDADEGVSPFPCAQLLFEWGANALHRGDLDRAEEVFAQLAAILPQHLPGRQYRARVALARGAA